MSSCSGFGAAISAFIDGALDDPERVRLEAHLAECETCQSEREALDRVRSQLGALPRLEVPSHFTAQVMAAVIEEPALAATPSASPPAGPPASADPAASQEPPGCAELAEDLSASIDDDLQGDLAAQRIREHLARCAACQAERDQLERLRATLQRLPRLEVPPGFLERVLQGVQAIEAETVTRLEEARARRAVWWGRFGGFAQAAGLLLLVGAGSFLATPEFRPITAAVRQAPSHVVRDVQAKREGRRVLQEAQAAADEAPSQPALPDGPYAAVLELEPNTAFAEAQSTLAQAVARYAQRTEGLLQTEGFQGYVVEVPANLTDDLFRELDASSAVRTARDDQAEVERITTELDTVELKSGHVFAGHVQHRGRDVTLSVGETQLTFTANEVARITPASEPRRLRLELRQRD